MNRRQFSTALADFVLLSGFAGKSTIAEEPTAMTTIPFQITTPQAQLEDLKYRLQHTRRPDQPEDADWSLGTDLHYLKRLTDYWIDGYDWRKAEDSLNALGNFKVEIDGIELHLVHRPLANPNATPLLLLHGWPDSFYRYHKVIDTLSKDFHVVVPSMPGSGFSSRTALPMDQVADLFARLMTETLGYGKFLAADAAGLLFLNQGVRLWSLRKAAVSASSLGNSKMGAVAQSI
jgi:hypothetical protein